MVLKTMILAGLLAGCAYCSHGYAHEKHGIAGTSVASLDTTQPEFTGVASAVRKGQQIQIVPSEIGRTQQQLSTPRFCAALASVECIGRPDIKVKVHPEPTQWRFQWDAGFPKDGELLVTFDSTPLLLSEQQRNEAASDGSMLLRACEADTRGEKLRYEPQPYKNTVGFWTEQGDSAAWRCHFSESGWYSVGLLQGCGKGQGGSEGRIVFVKEGEEIEAVACVVKETGHFQNFEWVHNGHVMIDVVGDYTVIIQPTQIKQKAFGDIRAVSIVRQQKQVLKDEE
ncbi:MAG TPA: hypothetical protein DDZ24_04360 [Planctomycetaceae bacterium]|nr:hypothetical protein [Planctomycetaceae bacterium]